MGINYFYFYSFNGILTIFYNSVLLLSTIFFTCLVFGFFYGLFFKVIGKNAEDIF